MRALWQGSAYWPAWLAFTAGTFLLREIWALTTGHPGDTLSEWVWHILKIARNEPVTAWSAVDYLVFGAWATLVTWLTWHFFFRRFT